MKTNKILSLLLALIMLIGVAMPTDVVFADTVGPYTYTVDGSGNATITKYTGPSGVVVIPDHLGVNPVVAVGGTAFMEKGLTEVTIPDSVTEIGERAFRSNEITTLSIGKGMKKIGIQAFENNLLQEVVITEGVEVIETTAFNYNKLTVVHLPYSLTTIGFLSFDNNGGTQDSINISGTANELRGKTWTYVNNTWSSIPLAMQDQDAPSDLTGVSPTAALNDGKITGTTSEMAYKLSTDTDYTDISGTEVTGLVAGTYSVVYKAKPGFYVSNETQVVINNYEAPQLFTYTTSGGVATITDYNQYEGGLSPNIPNTLGGYPVTAIGDDAFYMKGITGVTLPNSIITIGARAFKDNKMTSLTLGTSLKTIGEGAFYGNELTSVVIPNGVEKIGTDAFRYNCLRSVKIPYSLTSIGFEVFRSNGENQDSINIEGTLNDIKGKTWTYATGNWSSTPLPLQGQDAPIDLLGVTPTAALNDGKITGTTTDMQYKLATNPTYVDVTGTEVTGLVAGTYDVRYKAKTGYDASLVTQVVVSTYVSPYTYTTTGGVATITGYTGPTGVAIVIPDTLGGNPVTAIGNEAFKNKGLTGVTLPNTLVTIGEIAFYTNSLQTVVIPDSVTVISHEAFSTNSISSLTLGNNVKAIGYGTFQMNKLQTVVIPDGLVTLGTEAFLNNGTASNSEDLEPDARGRWNVVGTNWVKYVPKSSDSTIAFKSNTYKEICLVGGTIEGDTLPIIEGVTTVGALISNLNIPVNAEWKVMTPIEYSVVTGYNAFTNSSAYLNSDTLKNGDYLLVYAEDKVNHSDYIIVTTSKQSQEAPTSVGTTASTNLAMTDGKLTGTTALMEYQTKQDYVDESNNWIPAEEGTTDVSTDVYMVRYKENSTNSASSAIEKVVGFTSPFAGGTGEIATPYQIETAAQLNSVRYHIINPITKLGNNFILTKDIDLGVAPYNAEDGWVPIKELKGNFNGNGHVIKNMTVNEVDEYNTGLFRVVLHGEVTNLGIKDATVIGENCVGILAGTIDEKSHIENVYVTGTVKGESAVGGITGVLGGSDKTIKNCYAIVNVTGTQRLGGLVGESRESRIANSYFVGTITSAGIYVGGIVGRDYTPNTFTSNYYNATDTTGFITTGGAYKSVAQMQDKNTFLAGTTEDEIWDFNTVWSINPAVNNGYPTLRVFGVAPIVTPPTPGGGGGGSSTPPVKTPDSAVTVNGQKENAGKETKQTVDGKVQVVLSVDTTVLTKKIEDVLKSKTDSKQNLVELAVGSGDKATVQLTGDMVKKMETGKFDLSITKDKVVYKIPASEITIDKVAGILAVNAKDLKAIAVDVKINEVSESVLAKYNEIAKKQESKFVVKPVEFEIVAKTTGTDGKVRETTVSKFTNYVERVIAIPEGVAKGKITTGVVFNPDGTFSHVPTDIFLKDGKYYAKLNSLTNSTYSVIENPIEVTSVKGHWSEKTVNDMASRLVLVDYKNFEPNKAVTRAEFADYIVRALGLYREGATVKSSFKDVTEGSKNQVSIQIASDWGILSGYPDGTFKATNTITRQEAMTMYAKAMDIAKILENKANKLATYTDKAKVATWATPSVTRVVNAEIFNGKGNGVLDPKGTLTEAEALTAVRNLLLKAELINQ